jgi:putative transposase
LSTTQEIYAFTVFERAFKDFGLPQPIRSDNGMPFANPHALFGLSKLAVWWLRLGIHIERIKPAAQTLLREPSAAAVPAAPEDEENTA